MKGKPAFRETPREASSESTQVASAPFWRKLMRWGMYLLLALLILVAIAAAALYFGLRHLNDGSVKRYEDVAMLNGGTVTFRNLDFLAWDSYPTLHLYVDSLRLASGDQVPGPNEFLRVGHGELTVTVNPFGDTLIIVDSLRVVGGGVHLVAPAKPPGDLDRSVQRGNETPATPKLWWDERVVLSKGLQPTIQDFEFHYEKPSEGHDVLAHLDSVLIQNLQAGDGLSVDLFVAAHVSGLQFSDREGAYGRNSKLSGHFEMDVDKNVTRILSQDLVIGDNAIDFRAELFEPGTDTSSLVFAMDSSVLARARPLLAPGIDSIISPYNVEGVFGSVTTIYLPPTRGDRPVVTVDMYLPDNFAQIDTLKFYNTHLQAQFANIVGPELNFNRDRTPGGRLSIDTVRTDFLGFSSTASDALIIAPVGVSPQLIAPGVVAEGSAEAFAKLIGATNFSYTTGLAFIEADVVGPLFDINELIAQTNGRLQLKALEVGVPGTSTSLPLEEAVMTKSGANAKIAAKGRFGNSDHTFEITGDVAGVRALLRSGTDDSLATDVTLQASHVAWEDLLGVFAMSDAVGDAVADAVSTSPTASTSPPSTDTTQVAAVRALKTALRSAQESFSPSITLQIDTVSYYGMQAFDFSSGLHFTDNDSLVLERSRLRLPSGDIAFRGALELEPERRTGYSLNLSATDLNLEEIAAEFDYFGQEFLRDVGTLPNRVDLDLNQLGTLDAVRGLMPNKSRGKLSIVSEGTRPFQAHINYEPDRPAEPEFESTRVQIAGSPELINGFLQTERFEFVGGAFDFRMAYGGLVPTLRSFLEDHSMTLDVDQAGVRLTEVGATVPVRDLSVSLQQDTADIFLFVRSDSLDQEVTIHGRARHLSELALGGTGKHFSSQISVTSPRLVWSDLSALIDGFVPEDTTAARPVSLGLKAPKRAVSAGASALGTDDLSTIREVVAAGNSTVVPADTAAQVGLRENLRSLLTAFDPDAELCIDELVLSDEYTVDKLTGRLHMSADSTVYLDTTSFSYRDQALGVSGKFELADLERGDFELHALTERLDLVDLLRGFDYFDIEELSQAGSLSGILSLDLDLAGTIVGADSARLLAGSGRGQARFNLVELELVEVPTLNSLGKKFLQRERLDTVLFAPVVSTLQFDGGRIQLPLTEIQTNGFNAFIEGDIGIGAGDTTSLWISVPVAALFRDAGSDIPPLEGWEEHRFKVHVKLEDGPHLEAMKTKFRLRKPEED